MYVDVEEVIKENLYYKVLLKSLIYRKTQSLSFIWDIILIENTHLWIDNFEAANMSEEAALCGLILSYV